MLKKMMWKKAFTGLIVLMLMVSLAAPLSAFAGDNDDILGGHGANAGTMMVDFLVCRPLGLVATVFGYAVAVVSLPFSITGQNTEPVFNEMFMEPAQYTFARPLGEF